VHEMQTTVTDDHSVCLSVSLSVPQLDCVSCIRAAFAKSLLPLVFCIFVLCLREGTWK